MKYLQGSVSVHIALGNVLSGAVGGLQIASSLAGILYASVAGIYLRGIMDSSQQIVVHKDRENVKSRRTSVNRSSSPGKKMNPSWWERRGTQLLPLMKCQLLTNVDWERQKENNGVLHARSIQEARCTSQHPIEFLPSAVIIPQSCTLSSPVTTGCGSWLAAQTGQRYFHNIRIYVRRILNTANEYHPEAAEKQYQQSR